MYESVCVTPCSKSYSGFQSSQVFSMASKAFFNLAPGHHQLLQPCLPHWAPSQRPLAILWAHPASSAKGPLHLLFPFWYGLFLDSPMAHSLMSFTTVPEGPLWPVWPFFSDYSVEDVTLLTPSLLLIISYPFYLEIIHTDTHTHTCLYPYDWSVPAIVLVSPWRELCCRAMWYFKK